MDNQNSYPSSSHPYTYPVPAYPPQDSFPQPVYPPPSGHLSYPYPAHFPSPLGPHRPPDYTPYPGPPQPAPHQQPSLHTYGSFRHESFHYLNHQPYSTALHPPPDSHPEVPPMTPPSPLHQPTLQAYSSFQHESFHYHNHQSSPDALQPPPDSQPESPPMIHHDHTLSISDSTNSVHVGDISSNYPSDHQPFDDQLSSMHLSDNNPPNMPQKFHSGPLPSTSNNSHNGSGAIYGHRTSSFSGILNRKNGSQSGKWLPFSPSKTSLRVLLLHGNLDIWVHEAKNLPNMDMFHRTIGDMFNRLPGNMTSKIEGQINRRITSDPYVTIMVTDATVARTYVISNDENPVWSQNFIVAVAHNAAEVNFIVKDNDVLGSQYIGTVSIPVENIYGGERVQGTFPILNAAGKQCKSGSVLSLSIQYYPIERLSSYHNGIEAGPDYAGVPGTYFPLRRGGTVRLYQDAHVPDNSLPNLMIDNGMPYIHGKCWRDIFDAIQQARRLIYITGWSVWHKVKLVRDDNSLSEYTLGELLKSKSQEGMRVLLLVWDDPTSRSILGYNTDGVMQTHDEETRRFFKNSSVQVLLCPRVAGKRHSWVKQREVGVIYTHHQKTVVLDSDAGYNRRRIIAFLGGLDLCDGRYDTPEHPIFRTLQTVHSDDYHNPTYAGNVSGCPREPWHDMHCKIDGPAAYDVLTNFEERWLKASKPQGIKKLKKSYDDSLLRIERMPDILGLSDAQCIGDNDPENWHVQIFRSIDSNSVKGFPKDPKEGTMRNLVCGKNVLIDMSIHSAYVKAIRGAQHFIYIENQYFIGSSYNWSQYKDVGATNLIPMEIALKVADKIRAHERFAVYIVIPMWPEGNPTGNATQRILFWQHKTMQMMYETIYKALVDVGLEDAYTLQDYLNFYCLGNREVVDGNDFSENQPPANTPQGLSRKSRRFMIYVHSKGMIVDDEYVILGSANINQRSMEGTRDTEIAMGAYQPHHTWARKLSSPQGQIYGYRMSLWAEHVGFLEECFTWPEGIDCVRRVRSMGQANWEQFASNEISEMRGHLLTYPVDVDRKGKVRPLPGFETFPDVGGNIVGSFLAIQENLTI